MATENGPNIFDSCVYCCPKCKGLFQCQEEHLKHQMACVGNPFKSTSLYFACERKIFLQLYQSDDFPLDGYFNVQNISKDDSFINHVVKIRLSQETFDPSIFLRSAASGTDPQDDDFLLDQPDIDALESDINKDVTYLETSKSNFQEDVGQEQLRNIINKNIDYLKSDPVANLSSDSSKQLSYEQAGVETRLLSPIEKHFMHDVSKSRLVSPFEKNVNFLQDTTTPYQSSSFQYSSNQSIPYSCNLSTDLLGSLASTQDENQQSLQTSIEECPTLQYLDLAKKDPFFGQNLGLTQMNAKDPFLINATVRLEKPPTVPQKYPQLTKDDLHATPSPTFPLQDVNYFNFGSMLDEPTQLDYLDLATLDFLTNPNFGSYGTGPVKDKYNFEVDKHDMYSESSFISNDLSTVAISDIDRFDRYSPCTKKDIVKVTRDDSMVKKGKKCLPKRTKSCSNVKKKGTLKEKMDPALEAVVERMRQRHEERKKKSEKMANESNRFMASSAKRSARKRKYSLNEDSSHDISDQPKWKHERRFTKRLCPSNDILNVKKHLTGFTEEEMRSLNAVLGLNSITIKKQKTSTSKRIENSQSSQFNKLEDVNDRIPETTSNIPKTKNTKVVNAEKQKSVVKCPQCDFHCTTVEELQEHCDENRCVFKCQECSFTCNNELSLKEHCSRHKYHVNLKCQQCNFICVKVSELISHMSVHKRTSVLRTNEQAFEDTYYGESFAANAEYENMRMWLNGQRSVDDCDLYAYESLMSIRSSASDSGLFLNFGPNSQKTATDSLEMEENVTSDIKFQRSVSLNDSTSLERPSHVLLLNQILPPVNEAMSTMDDAISVYESTSTGNESATFIQDVDTRELDRPGGCSIIDGESAQSVSDDGILTSDPNTLLVKSSLISSSVSTPSSDSILFPDELTLAVKSISLCSVPDDNNVDFSNKELNTDGDSDAVICSTKPLISEPGADVSQIYVTSPLLETSSHMMGSKEQSGSILTFSNPELRNIESMAFETEQLTPDDKCIVVFPELIEKVDLGCGREASDVDRLGTFDKSKECTNISDNTLDTEEVILNRPTDTNLGQDFIRFPNTVLTYDGMNDCENGGVNKYVSEKALSNDDHFASVANLVSLSNNGALSVSSETTKVILCEPKLITTHNQSKNISGSTVFPNRTVPSSCEFSENEAEPNKYSFRPIKSDDDSEAAMNDIVDEDILCRSIGQEKSEDTDFVKSLLTDNKTPILVSGTSQQVGVKSTKDLLVFTQSQFSQFIKQSPGPAEEGILFKTTASDLKANCGPELFESKQMRRETHCQKKIAVLETIQHHFNEHGIPKVSTANERRDLNRLDQSSGKEIQDKHHVFQPFTILTQQTSQEDRASLIERLKTDIRQTVSEKSYCKEDSDAFDEKFQEVKADEEDHESIKYGQMKLPGTKPKSDTPIGSKISVLPDESIQPDKVAHVDQVCREESTQTQFPEYKTWRSKTVTKAKKVKTEKKKSTGFHCKKCTYQCDTRYQLGKHLKTHNMERELPADKAADSNQKPHIVIKVEFKEVVQDTVPVEEQEVVISNDFDEQNMESSEQQNALMPIPAFICSHCSFTCSSETDVTDHEKYHREQCTTEMELNQFSNIHGNQLSSDVEMVAHENIDGKQSSVYDMFLDLENVQGNTLTSEAGLSEHNYSYRRNLISNKEVADPNKKYSKCLTSENKHAGNNTERLLGIENGTLDMEIKHPVKVQVALQDGKALPHKTVPDDAQKRCEVKQKAATLVWKSLLKRPLKGCDGIQDRTTLQQTAVPGAVQKDLEGIDGGTTSPQVTVLEGPQKGLEVKAGVTTCSQKTVPKAAQKSCEVIWVGLPEGKTLAPPPKKKDPVLFFCEHCDFKTKQKMSLQRHVRRIHSGEPKTRVPRPAKEVYLCDMPGCEFETTVRKHLHKHEVEQHLGLRAKLCDTCGTLLPDFASFQQHQRKEHQPELRFKCYDCSHRSNKRADIIKHYRRKHLRQQQYACNLCEYHTDYVQQLKFHLMAHAGIRPYKCSKCDYHVNNMNKLTRHIKTRHKFETGVTCEKTDLTYCVDGSQFRCLERTDIRDNDIKVIELTDIDIENLNESENEAKVKNKTVALNETEKVPQTSEHLKVSSEEVELVTEDSPGTADDEVTDVSMKSIEVMRVSMKSKGADRYHTVYQCSLCSYMMTSKDEIASHQVNCEWQKVW